MPGLVLDANNSKPRFSHSSTDPKAGSQWSFSFRGGYQSDDSDSSEDLEGTTTGAHADSAHSKDGQSGKDKDKDKDKPIPKKKEVLSEDARLLRDLDIASRAEDDSAEFKANPWSIARVNAASRPAHPIASPSPTSNPVQAGKTVRGPANAKPGLRGKDAGARPAAAATAVVGAGRKNISSEKKTIKGYFAVANLNNKRKPASTSGGRTDTRHKPAPIPLPRPRPTRTSSSQVGTVPQLPPCVSRDKDQSLESAQIITGSQSDVAIPADVPPNLAHFATMENYAYSCDANATDVPKELDSRTEDFDELLATDQESSSGRLVEIPTSPWSSHPPIYASQSSPAGSQRMFSMSRVPSSSQNSARLSNSQQGPFSSPLRHNTGTFVPRVPLVRNQTPRIGQLASANSNANFSPTRQGEAGLTDLERVPTRLHHGQSQAFSSPLRQHEFNGVPSLGGAHYSGRAALGLSSARPARQNVQPSNLYLPPGDIYQCAEGPEHTLSKPMPVNTQPSSSLPARVRLHVADEADVYSKEETKENRPDDYEDAPPIPAPDFTSFAHSHSRGPAVNSSPPSSPPRLPFPSKRPPAAPSSKTTLDFGQELDAYSAFTEDDDASWSTFPARKKARKGRKGTSGNTDVGAKSMKQSGRFRLPIVLPSRSTSAAGANEKRNEPQMKRRVITYLPPPRNAQASMDSVVGNSKKRSSSKETMRQNNGNKDTGKTVKPVTEWSIKRFGYGYDAGPGGGAKLNSRGADPKLRASVVQPRAHVDTDGDRHSDAGDCQPPVSSDDSSATLVNSNPVMPALDKLQANTAVVSVAFDAEDIARAYPAVRKAMLD